MPIIFNRRARCQKKPPGQEQLLMTDAMKAKRTELAALSRALKPLVQAGQYDSINEGLLDTYSGDDDLEFNTFKQWKEKGLSVKKGEKAFLVWGKPRRVPVPDATDDEDEFKFWPVCYLFSSDQVENRREVKNEK